jgi:hypothetical protein
LNPAIIRFIFSRLIGIGSFIGNAKQQVKEYS